MGVQIVTYSLHIVTHGVDSVTYRECHVTNRAHLERDEGYRLCRTDFDDFFIFSMNFLHRRPRMRHDGALARHLCYDILVMTY